MEEKSNGPDLNVEISQLKSKIYELESELNEIKSSSEWQTIRVLRNLIGSNRFIKILLIKLMDIIRNIYKRRSNNGKSLVEKTASYLANIPENIDLAICHSDWLGVRNSTEDLFQYTLTLNELFETSTINTTADLIIKKKVKSVTFSGFAEGFKELAECIKAKDSTLSIYIFWHGNTTHMYEEYSWRRYQEVLGLLDAGTVNKWAFAKESMARLYKEAGYSTYFLPNAVKRENSQNFDNEKNDSSDSRIGIYASGDTWNKNIFSQIAAVKIMNDFTVHAIPLTKRILEFSESLGVNVKGERQPIPREDLMNHISQNEVNLYVTFSECAPLLPLESLNRGVPCLTGPNHHYFKGSRLEEYLVVNEPDNPYEIARKALIALENKEEIIRLYSDWYNRNLVHSKQSVKVFLEE